MNEVSFHATTRMATYDCEDQARYRQLLCMSMGDRALAERLIRYEAGRAPQLGRAEHIQRAIDSWVGDHNRWR